MTKMSVQRVRLIRNNRSAKDGSPFQSETPTIEKARFCLVVVRAKGTIRKPRSIEEREWRPGILMEVQQRYCR